MDTGRPSQLQRARIWRRSSISKKSSPGTAVSGQRTPGVRMVAASPGAGPRSRAARRCRATPRRHLPLGGGAARSISARRRTRLSVLPPARSTRSASQSVGLAGGTSLRARPARGASRAASASPTSFSREANPSSTRNRIFSRELGLEGDLEARLAQPRKGAREHRHLGVEGVERLGTARPAAETRSSPRRSWARPACGRPCLDDPWARERTRRARCRGRTARAAGPGARSGRCSRPSRGSRRPRRGRAPSRRPSRW